MKLFSEGKNNDKAEHNGCMADCQAEPVRVFWSDCRLGGVAMKIRVILAAMVWVGLGLYWKSLLLLSK